MPMPLSALPKAFVLTDEHSKKGTFLHFFNIPENDLYVGPLPPVDDYCLDTMSIEVRKEFYEWYDACKNDCVFDFKKKILERCVSDGTILRRACFAYRIFFLNVVMLYPFAECTTIASACSRIYRKNLLLPKTIGIIPNGGYGRANKQSVKAIEWLLCVEREIWVEIQHATRSREFRLLEGAVVDGYYIDGVGKPHVLQLHGCFWHKCLDCYKLNRDEKCTSGDIIYMRHENTRITSARIRKAGYVLTEIGECKYDKLKKNHPV
ncbi:uncharacterized protein LOC117182890 [Belonocnema kinseyi]|uniref:uncharacterized protein LOC117182890 n=1 Tax=Belonocnema kinseyi TaxID=2817044 RepID=UPI00143DA39C|nr:uncharacterized protein LOC117182890 [Belonocnema kinseyi]